MVRRLTTAMIGLVLASGVLLAAPQAAYACGGGSTEDDCSVALSATVNASITLTFSDNTAAFGAVNAGTRTVQVGTLAYHVSTNNGAGFHIDLANDGANVNGYGGGTGTGIQFSLCPTGLCVTQADYNGADGADVGGSNGNIITGGSAFRNVASGPVSADYTDDVQLLTGSNAIAGGYSQQVQYRAIVN